MLEQPMMEKLQAMRLHGMVEALERQQQDSAMRERSFTERLALAGGSPMELPPKSGTHSSTPPCQAPHQRLSGGYGLSYPTGPGAKCAARPHPRLGLGKATRQHFRVRSHRSREKLCSLCPGPEGLSRWLLGAVQTRGCFVPRSRSGSCRRQLASAPDPAQPHRCARHR